MPRLKLVLPAVVFACVLLSTSHASAQRIGKPLPEFKLEGSQEGEFTLAKNRGNIVVMLFWRTTNTQSVDSLVEVSELAQTFRPRGVIFWAHTVEPRDKWEPVIKGKEIEGVELLSGGNLQQVYEVSSLPRVFIVDTLGRLAWTGHPGDNLEERIKDQIAATPPKGAEAEELQARLEKAKELLGKEQLGRAYGQAKAVQDVSVKDSEVWNAAKSVIEEIEEAAKAWIDESREARGEALDKACNRMAEISVRMAKTDRARDADEVITKLRGDSETKAKIRVAIENQKGWVKNDDAAELVKNKLFDAAAELYREVVENHKNTEAATAAKKELDKIESDPKLRDARTKRLNEEQASRWLDIADRYARVELYSLAREQYERIIKDFPSAQAAIRARDRLKKLPKTDPPDDVEKPKSASQPATQPAEPAKDKGKDKGGKGGEKGKGGKKD